MARRGRSGRNTTAGGNLADASARPLRQGDLHPLGSREFIRDLMHRHGPRKRLPLPGTIEVQKPTPPTTPAAAPGPDEDELRLCAISPLPLRRVNDLRSLTVLRDIVPGDYRGSEGPALDGPPLYAAGSEAALLNTYAHEHGVTRHRYARAVPDAFESFSSVNEIPSVDFEAYLVEQWIRRILVAPYVTEDDDIHNPLENEVSSFRVRVLGWDNPTTSVAPLYQSVRLGNYSDFPPESLTDVIGQMALIVGDFRASAKATLNLRSGTISSEIDVVRESITDAAADSSVTDTDRRLQESVAVIDELLVFLAGPARASTGASSPLWATHGSKPPVVTDVYHNKLGTRGVDLAAFHASEDKTQWLESTSWVLQLSLGLSDSLAFIQGRPPGTTILYQPELYDWLLGLRAAIEAHDQMPPEASDALAALFRQQVDLQGQLHQLQSLGTEIETRQLVDRAVGVLADWLSQHHAHVRLVTEGWLPLATFSRTGAYGEFVPNQLELRPVPRHRQHDFFAQRPTVSLLKEYSLASHHDGFGIGAHLYSQALFPGEEVTLEMRSYHKTTLEVTASTADRILEETSANSARDFSEELGDEFNKSALDASSQDHEVAVKLGVQAGIYNAQAGYTGKFSAQEELRTASRVFGKTLSKLSGRLSDKRQVSFEVERTEKSTTTVEDELKTTRRFSNINKEQTLMFNFFQITRGIRAELTLEDVKLVYDSGRYRIERVYVGKSVDVEALLEDPVLESLRDFLETAGVGKDWLEASGAVRPLPPEVWSLYADDCIVFLLSPVATAVLPLAKANEFFVRTFDRDVAISLSEAVFEQIGGGPRARQGLNVAAFQVYDPQAEGWPHLPDGEPWPSYDWRGAGHRVVGDLAVVDGQEFTLPNVDIRYQADMHPLALFHAVEGQRSLPFDVWRQKYVVNTNGVYAENLLGKCSALEPFALRHRELDVRTKELEIEEKALANARDRAFMPPLRDDHLGEDGALDMESYTEAIELYRLLHHGPEASRPSLVLPPGTDIDVELSANLGDDVVFAEPGDGA